jgi:hypothetical protein
VRIESGAKSALDPNQPVQIKPYIADDAPDLNLSITNITTIEAGRTFWDKVVIAHGLRRQEGQRVSRPYYDLHCMLSSAVGRAALKQPALGIDCVRHARMFFDRPDYDLASATPGSFALAPIDGMIEALNRDYDNTKAMIFGTAPELTDILTSVSAIKRIANDTATTRG